MERVVLADTSVLIDQLRNDLNAREALTAFADEGGQLAASGVTRVEILAGMRASEKRATRVLIDEIIWLPVLNDVAERAGEFARKYRASHRGVDTADYIIAATAERHDLELWTRNVKHFPMFPELTAPY